jgi:hypothetical protein
VKGGLTDIHNALMIIFHFHNVLVWLRQLGHFLHNVPIQGKLHQVAQLLLAGVIDAVLIVLKQRESGWLKRRGG